MSAYTPPTYSVTPFNPAYYATDSGGLSLADASGLFLNKTSADTATALETFTAGIAVNSIQPTATTTTMLINSTMTSGDMYIGANVAANNARTGVIHIGDSNAIASGGAVHINNGTTNTSNTNINNGLTSSGNLNLMSGGSCSGSINIGTGNTSNPTVNILTGQNCTGIVNIASASVGTNTVITNIGNGTTSGQINIGNINNATVIGGTCGIGDSNATSCNVTISNGNNVSNSVLIACGTGANGSTVGICTGTTTGDLTLGNSSNAVKIKGAVTLSKPLILGTVPTANTQLGYVSSNTLTTVTATGNFTLSSLTLPAGIHLLTFNVQMNFSIAPTLMLFNFTGTNADTQTMLGVLRPTSTYSHFCTGSQVVTTTASAYTIFVTNTSGTATSVSGYFQAVRIG